jgi:hypothetical protein
MENGGPVQRFAALALIPLALWMARPWVAEWRYLNDRARAGIIRRRRCARLGRADASAWKIAALEMDVEARPGAPARFAISAETFPRPRFFTALLRFRPPGARLKHGGKMENLRAPPAIRASSRRLDSAVRSAAGAGGKTADRVHGAFAAGRAPAF